MKYGESHKNNVFFNVCIMLILSNSSLLVLMPLNCRLPRMRRLLSRDMVAIQP